MHESTQRLLCRVAFLLGCVLPTLGTLSWIAYRQSSWSVAAIEARISEEIGLKCRVARYYNPKPTKWVFEDLRLERAGHQALHLPVLKAELVDGQWQLAADEATVDWHAKDRLWDTLQEALLLRKTSGNSLQLNVAQVHISGRELPPLHGLTVTHKPENSPALVAQARVGDAPDSPALHLALDTSTPNWRLQMGTQEGLLTRHLGQVLPQFADLGGAALFQGWMTFHLGENRGNAEVGGHFRQLDLKSTLASRFGQHGAGTADLYLNSALIRDGVLHEAHGVLASQNGQLSTRLIDRAVEHLRLRLVPISRDRDLVAFHELAVGFRFDHGRMTLTGLCENMPPGTMLAGLDQPLLLESDQSILPATNLASVFHEPHAGSVPASQRSVDMARWLAVPGAVPLVAEQPNGLHR